MPKIKRPSAVLILSFLALLLVVPLLTLSVIHLEGPDTRREVLVDLTWVGLVAIIAVTLALLPLWRQQSRSQRLEFLARTGERDRLLSLFYDLPFMGMAIVDPSDGHWLYVNDCLCEILGYSHEELLTTTTWEQLTHPDDLPASMAEYRRMLAGESDGYQMEKRCLRKDGSSVDVILAVKCVRHPDGSVEYIVKTVRDISERKRLETTRVEQLRATGLLDAIAAASTDAIFAKDTQGNYLFFNNEAAREVNRRPREVVGNSDMSLYPPDQANRIMAMDREVMVSGEPITFEETLSTVDGERTFLTTKGPLLDNGGRTIGLYGISRDISERKLAEERLRQNQEQLQLFIAHAPICIAMFDRDMNTLAYSHRWLEDYGRGYDSLSGRNHYEVHPDMPEDWKVIHRRGLAGETLKNEADHWIQADGSEHWLRWAVLPWRDAAGSIGGIIISAEDITERQRIEQALFESRARLAGIIDSAMDAIIALDEQQRVRMFNPAAERMFGFKSEEILGESVERLIPAPLRQAHRQHVQRFVEEGVTSRDMNALGELRALRRDGTEFPIEASISMVSVDGERIFTAILRDVSERKSAETALRYQLDLTRSITEKATDSIFICDTAGRVTAVNPEAERMFGYPAGELMGQVLHEVIHHHYPDGRPYPTSECPLCRVYTTGEVIRNHEAIVFRKDGSRLIVTGSNAALESGGRMAGAALILHDITAIKQAEQALREREDDLNRAQAVGHIGSWRLDVRRNELTWSEENHHIFGVPEGTPMTYETFLSCVHPDDRAYVDQEWQAGLRGEPYDIEHRLLVHGQVKWVREKAELEFDADGNLLGGFGTTQDITSIKQAEQALREADQRKDEFLAMLAHELRNPLAPIRNAAHVLGQLGLDEPRVRWAQDIIERQVAHLTHLVDELLDVSRIARGKISLKKTRIELTDLVRQVCESVQPLMSAKGHRFEVRLPETVVMLEGDLVRLIQVLQNLLNNAAKYTPDGGYIELVGRQLGQEIEIQVRDNGMGIPADLLPSVFDLFRQGERTLDRSLGGLGIGLTLVRRLVELHGGRVEAHSAGPGLGTTFTVRLPAADNVVGEPRQVVGKPGVNASRLRVLVVDDEPLVAESMTVFLELEGHQVRSADSGETALRLLREFQPQVVLLDIGLPGQDGYEVARRIRQVPGGHAVKLLAVSGYGHVEAREHSRQAGFDHHLVKPVDPVMLGELLTEIGAQADRPLQPQGHGSTPE